MKKLFLFFLICFSFFRCAAQSFYVSGTSYKTNGNPAFRYEVRKVTINGGYVESELINSCDGNSYFPLNRVLEPFPIAANSTGFFWMYGNNLFSSDFDPANSVLSNCNVSSSQLTSSSNSLTAGKNGKLYYMDGSSLGVFDIATKQSKILGNTGYAPSGDLTFYKGELYMASIAGIVQVNINDPGKSFLYMTIPAAYGLITVSTGANKNTVYSIVQETGNLNAIHEIDMENKREVGIVGYLNFIVLDAASPYEDGSVLGVNIERISVRQDCASPNAGMAEVVTTGPDDTFLYRLNNGQTSKTGVFGGLAPGPYQVEVTSLGNPKKIASFTVPAYSSAPPTYTFSTKKRVCDAPGEISFKTTTGTSTYKIQLGSNTFPLDHVFTNLKGSDYHFSILNDNGCQVAQEDIMLPRDKCTIQFDKTVVSKECSTVNKGRITVITNAHTDAYTYTLNGTRNTTGVFSMLSPGDYDVLITSPEDSKTVTATIPDYSLNKPAVTYKLNNPACNALGEIKFETTNSTQYQIKYGTDVFNFSSSITGLKAGTTHFTIVDLQGCVVDEIDVAILQDECSPVVFPTAFTPNGDGINDIFRSDPSSKATNFTFTVYDRWGSLIYTSSGLNNGWDGNRNGKPVPVATYYWTATYITQERKAATQKGSVTLIR